MCWSFSFWLFEVACLLYTHPLLDINMLEMFSFRGSQALLGPLVFSLIWSMKWIALMKWLILIWTNHGTMYQRPTNQCLLLVWCVQDGYLWDALSTECKRYLRACYRSSGTLDSWAGMSRDCISDRWSTDVLVDICVCVIFCCIYLFGLTFYWTRRAGMWLKKLKSAEDVPNTAVLNILCIFIG